MYFETVAANNEHPALNHEDLGRFRRDKIAYFDTIN
jgi:hypothetical protein